VLKDVDGRSVECFLRNNGLNVLNSARQQNSGNARSGLRIVILWSFLSMEIGILGGVLFKNWETASADLFMTWRHVFTRSSSALVNPYIAALAIDTKTQNRMGRFPAGKWLSREAYSDQLSFFDNFLSPTVLAYDIVFQDSVGESSRDNEKLSESPEKIKRMIDGLTKIYRDPGESLDEQTLFDMNDFALEQGNINMVHRLASISENKKITPVIGYYFRVKSQTASISKMADWTDEEVFGMDTSGDETKGSAIPYLLDVSIPHENIHFARYQKYEYQGTANLSSREMRDYALLGFLNAAPDEDGIMRRLPLVLGFKYRNSKKGKEATVFVPSLALVSCIVHQGLAFPLQKGDVEVYMGREIVIHSRRGDDMHVPIDENGRLYLNFTAKFNDFPAVSFADVAPSYSSTTREYKIKLAEKYKPHIDGRIVLTGINAAGLDVGPCPIESRSPLMVVHLTAINNILNREFIAPLNFNGKVFLWLCLFATFSTICSLQRTSRLGFDTALFAVLYLAIAFACVYKSWVILPVIGPMIYVGTGSVAVLSYRFISEEKARRRIRQMFSTMVSDQVLTYLEENPDSFSLRGHNVDATVFFSDVVNFTGISERLTPERLTELLNLYLTPATDLILSCGGYVDKYVGDGIMAVWGAPYPDSEHAFKACLSALRQQDMLFKLNLRLKEEFAVEIAVRMGLNSGTVKAGNMGSERKFQYTVIGDAVNLASRLEPTNKDFGTRIIAGESTVKMLKGKIVTRRLGKLMVVGKEEVVTIYEIIGEVGMVNPRQFEVIALYESALDCFYQKAWSECVSMADSILKIDHDGPTVHLRARAEHYLSSPPDSSWQGEYKRTEKD